jgi:putative addiction module antidote
MVPLKITRIGNSLGVVLPKEAVSHLRVEQGDALYLTEAPDGYRLTAFDPQFEAQMKAACSVMKKRRNVLRELAK